MEFFSFFCDFIYVSTTSPIYAPCNTIDQAPLNELSDLLFIIATEQL